MISTASPLSKSLILMIWTLLTALPMHLALAQMPNSLTNDEKIYGLSKFWSEANYNFVYMYKVDRKKWDDAFKKAISKVQAVENDYEYFRELQKLCALLKDGHTQVFLPENIQRNILTTNFGPYRLFLSHVQGKIFITNVNKSKELEIPLGSEILKVNGIPTAEYKEMYVKPYISSSTPHVLDAICADQLLSGPIGQRYDVTIKTPDGKVKNLSITHAPTTEKELAVEALSEPKIFEFKWLQDEIAYVALHSFSDASIVAEFESKLKELQRAKKIILDLRNNGGGSSRNAQNIAKYFVASDTIYGSRNYSREIIPADRAIGSFITEQDTLAGKAQWGISKKDATDLYNAYKGNKMYQYEYKPIVNYSRTKLTVPTAVLINGNTASAAEDFLIYLYDERNIVRVGDYTNGSTGQPLQIDLPGNTTAWICTKKVVLPNAQEFVGTGIRPHILIPQTLKDRIDPVRFDSQLKEAMEFLLKNE